MIIVLLADGFEEIEALTPVDMLRRAGLDVKTVGISGRAPTGAHGISVVCDATPDEIDLSKVTMAIFPGGMPGATNLDRSEYTDKVISAVTNNGGHLAAICAAPLIFGKRGLLIGKAATCYPGFENELKGANLTDCGCVTDGNITTAKAMGSALDFAEELIKICKSKEDADKVSGSIYRSEKATVKVKKEEKEEVVFTLADFLAKMEAEDEEPAVEKLDFTAPDYTSYTLPPIDLLTPDGATDEASHEEEIKETADTIIAAMAKFGIYARIVNAERGPRVTRYELIPEKNTSIRKIVNFADDVALVLGVEAIRAEAPLPGNNTVFFEVPNANPSIVRLRGIIESEEFENTESLTTAAIGRDISGKRIIHPIERMPHLLVGGSTGMGKSVLINSMLISALYKARPDQLKLILIDPKQVEYIPFKNLPHLLMPVITDPKKAVGALKWAQEEMERRYSLLSNTSARNIDGYNKTVAESEALPRILIVIDEFADLMLQVKNPIEELVMRLAQKARAAGIHLIISTQRPSTSVITGVIKANIPSRIACRVPSYVDSKTLLDVSGAEKLLGRGDALFTAIGSTKPQRIQCAYVSDREVEAVTDHIKAKAGEAVYDPNVIAFVDREAERLVSKPKKAAREEEEYSPLNDERFYEAVNVVVEWGKASTSLIQRKLSIGYGKAARFLDLMEEMEIVSEANGQKPREVLITKDAWEKKRSQLKDNK